MEDANTLIVKYLSRICTDSKIYVDIGSSNQTNLNSDLIEDSEFTLFIEADSQKSQHWEPASNFKIINEFATPSNIQGLVSPYIKDKDVAYLDIDIDGYDYYVLESFLNYKRPYIFIAEINEKIPPPIKFSVLFDENYWWDSSHFFGMSISKIFDLIERYQYDLIQLNGNNVICIRKDKNFTNLSLSAEDAYNEGYKNPRLSGELSCFDYNSDMDFLLSLPTEQALQAVREKFLIHDGKFIINI